MFDLKLFLGFSTDDSFQQELKLTNPYIVSQFIGREEYLHEVTYQDKYYLGKYLSVYPTPDQLEDLERHLLSLLNKLAPHYPFSDNPPVLVTIAHGG